MRRTGAMRKLGLFIGLGFLALLFFQNCSGFNTLDGANPSGTAGSNSLSSTDSSSSSSSSTPAQISKALTVTEWQPVELKLSSASGQTLSAKNLPSGAAFDAPTSTLLWMPKVGQAGTYHLKFSTSSVDNFLDLALTVNALPAATVAKGPIDGAKDGDVGFVFVHGMGTFDYCANPIPLNIYWGSGPDIVSRDAAVKKIGCYDGDKSPVTVAAGIARQILDANCGRYGKCIVITHSMGGLVLEFILDHARLPQASDPDATLFANHDLFAKAKDRILAVASIASAAGGVLASEKLDDPPDNFAETVAGMLTSIMDLKSEASRSMKLASVRNLAPFAADPGVPIYMIPGYTPQRAAEAGLNEWSAVYSSVPGTVYDRNNIYASLEFAVPTNSRSDGLVELRSGCGLASDDVNNGPGVSATLAQQLSYCYQSAKKPNHYVWFMTNMNHSFSQMQWSGCTDSATLCHNLDPDSAGSTMKINTAYDGKTVHEVMRSKLDANRAFWGTAQPVTIPVD